MTSPIIVNPDPTVAQLGVAVRYAVTIVGGYLVGKGWIDGDLVQVIAAVLTALAPAVYAFYRAHAQKRTMIQAATDPRNGGVVLANPQS